MKKKKRKKDKAVKTALLRAARAGAATWVGHPRVPQRRAVPCLGEASEALHPLAGGTLGTTINLSQLTLMKDFSDVYWAEIMLLRLNILNELQQISPRSLVTLSPVKRQLW